MKAEFFMACVVAIIGLNACSVDTPEPSLSRVNQHALIASAPDDEVSFDAFDAEGVYARVTLRRGDEEPADAGVPDALRDARYVAIHIRYEITASREDMIVGQNNWYLFQPGLDRDFHQVASGIVELEPELPAFRMPFSEGEVIEGWLTVELTKDRLNTDVYMAFADAGPFEPDDCCVARPPQSVAGTDALILLRVGEDD
jgi:hypothetical protein